MNHLQWRRRTLAALPEALSPSLAPVVSPSLAPATLQSPSSPGSCLVALNFDRLHLLKSQHQHAVASHRRSSTVNTGSPPSTPVMEDSINQEATADNNASVNNNMPADTPIPNDAANPNSRSANDSHSQGSSNLRGKTDLAWKYVSLQHVNGKPQYQCLFCLQVFNGGGIHRMKKHLAKIIGDVKKCPKVPYDVEKQMKSLLKDIQASKKKRKVSFGEEGGDEVEDAIDEAIAQEEQEQQRTSSEIDADLYPSGGGSSGLYAASLSSADQGGNEGEDHPTEADLQQVLADFDY
ncbi:hypothetical protein Ahy_B02g058551 [Arachis hypogaea]|uniref:BED-type domain-containing protein n=1 Tax=Arachis hypogaea TaxID=3818 RepID=A0A445AEU7_ARAHY|nr:hypothetical protein Ahy_B02g058551 [Arachis hypogaea]